MKSTWCSGIGFVALTGGFLFAYSGFGITAAAATSTAAVQSAYGRLPLSFEANHGQWDPAVQFVTRGPGHQLFLTPSDAVLALRTKGAKAEAREGDIHQRQPFSSSAPAWHSVVRMRFDGANPQTEIVGHDKLPGIVNYILGENPSKWRTNIPTYQKVKYRDLYPGVDLVYYSNQGQLEYDLIVAPGADPKQITLTFDGVETINVDEHGDLVLTVLQSSTDAAGEGAAPLRMHKPVVYQRDAHGNKQLLVGSYLLLTAKLSSDLSVSASSHPSEMTHVAFQVASYDESQPLIIDPVLAWATYLGGSGHEQAVGIAVDSTGDVYVTGSTSTPGSGFPGTAGGQLQSTLASEENDAFVAKLNAAGTALIYSTYLGGSGQDNGFAIAVDAAGQAHVTGYTNTPGSGFPGTAGSSIQSTFGGGNGDAFVAKLNAAGTALLYATYLGGSGVDQPGGIAVDQAGQAYVTGLTTTPGSGFPGTAGSLLQSTFAGGGLDAFVVKLNTAGTAFIYSTYLGGSGTDVGSGIAVDQAGNAYVTGFTTGPFPGTTGSLIQSMHGGIIDAFVVKLNAAGTAFVYSTYLGGSGQDSGNAIAVDQAGQAYVTGNTYTPGSGFPGTAGSLLQSTYGGGLGDAFVAKLNAAGTAFVYSTYLGGSGQDTGTGIAVDPAGQAYVTGITTTLGSGFPGTAGSLLQSTYGGGDYDAFIVKLNTTGTGLLYSSYLGSSQAEYGHGVSVDQTGQAYVAGYIETPGSDFPGTAGSLIQSTFGGGGTDAFVAKITSNLPFIAFKAKAEIDVRRRGDRFQVRTTFTLDPSNNGINLLTEAVTAQVGDFFATIPAGSFKLKKGRYIFEGIINGVKLEAVLRSLILGHDYEFTMEGKGADFTGLENPVTVSLTIGDDSGKATIDAQFE